MSNLPYRYQIKYNDIKCRFKSVQFTTPTTIEDKRAKSVIRSLYNKVRSNKLKVDQLGYINISGSDGDKILNSKLCIGINIIKIPAVTVDTTNEWWQD